MSDKLKIHWATPTHDIVGNALGYNQHVSAMKRFSEPFLEYDEKAEIALTICPADFFVPIPGKINVLFTMWESLDIPNNYLQRIQRADVLIVPCKFCYDLFRPYFEGPIYICREGIDPAKYQFHQRSLPHYAGEKFRFLWVGAMNPRKGWPIVAEIADKVIQKYSNVEIYMKTTTPKQDRKNFVSKLWKNRRSIKAENHDTYKRMLKDAKNPDVSNKIIFEGPNKNIIWDSRMLPSNELVDIYKSAHCFLFPTYGEGWGLTLCEAMATGLPAIAPPVTGCADYFDDRVGFPVGYDVRHSEFKNYDIVSRIYCPNINDVVIRMFEVMRNYPEALKRGRKASERILTKFTWQRSAERLRDILIEIESKVLKCEN